MSGFLRRFFKRGSQKSPDANKRQEPVLQWETQDFVPPASDDEPVVDPWDVGTPAPHSMERPVEPEVHDPDAGSLEAREPEQTECQQDRLDPAAAPAPDGPPEHAAEDDTFGGAAVAAGDAEPSNGGQTAEDTEPGAEEVDRPTVEFGDTDADDTIEAGSPVDAGASKDAGAETTCVWPASPEPRSVDYVETGQTGEPASGEASEEVRLDPADVLPADKSPPTSGKRAESLEGDVSEHVQDAAGLDSDDPVAEGLERSRPDTIDNDVWEELSAAEAGAGDTSAGDEPEIDGAASAIDLSAQDSEPDNSSFDVDSFEFEVVDPVDVDEDVDIDADVGASQQVDPWAEDLGAGFEPFDFDPDAHQSPWEGLDGADVEDITAHEKAARIAAEMDIVTPASQRQVARELTDLFQRLSHPATFRALAAAADNGLTPGLLRNMIALREIWAQRPDFWLRRHMKTGQIYKNYRGAGAMTWAMARRVCLQRDAYPPESMVDPDWVDEWLLLERGEPGYLDFAHFVDLKVANVAHESVLLGLRLAYQDLHDGHPADRWDWPLGHRVTDDYYPIYDLVARDRADVLQDMQQAKYPDRRQLHPVDLNPDLSYERYGKA